jgi:cold shock CspA family protein
MLSLTAHRLMRSTLTCPRIFHRVACHGAATASVSTSLSCSLTNSLSAGTSTRSFSTSPVCLAGVLHLCTIHLQSKPSRRPLQHAARQRLHGTVTAFKHRRGYGFVLAEGVVPNSEKPTYTSLDALQAQKAAGEASMTATAAANPPASQHKEGGEGDGMLHKTYFFTRASLDGGFYVTEGERVTFWVEPVDPALGTERHLGALPRYVRASTSAAAPALTDEFSLDTTEGGDGGSGGAAGAAATDAPPLMRATGIRFYDLRTGGQSPIIPITLYGKVVEWDDATGQGVIAELDTHQQYHADAPRFPVSLEDMDLGLGSVMHTGRFVRFCIGPASGRKGSGAAGAGTGEEDVDSEAGDAAAAHADEDNADQLVAQRVIIDFTLERRRGALGRPLVPSNAAPGTVTDQTRFAGVVREIRGNKFGFIMDDFSGESIFFHAVNARPNVREGDRVTYLLREVVRGKHEGKKACFDVRRDTGDAASRPGEVFAPSTAGTGADSSEAEADLLEVQEEYHHNADEFQRVRSSSPKAASRKKQTTAKSRSADELDFDLLH